MAEIIPEKRPTDIDNLGTCLIIGDTRDYFFASERDKKPYKLETIFYSNSTGLPNPNGARGVTATMTFRYVDEDSYDSNIDTLHAHLNDRAILRSETLEQEAQKPIVNLSPKNNRLNKLAIKSAQEKRKSYAPGGSGPSSWDEGIL